MRLEIAAGTACYAEVFEGSGGTQHYVGTLQCDANGGRLVIPAGEHVAGRLYVESYGGPVVLGHYELGED